MVARHWPRTASHDIGARPGAQRTGRLDDAWPRRRARGQRVARRRAQPALLLAPDAHTGSVGDARADAPSRRMAPRQPGGAKARSRGDGVRQTRTHAGGAPSRVHRPARCSLRRARPQHARPRARVCSRYDGQRARSSAPDASPGPRLERNTGQGQARPCAAPPSGRSRRCRSRASPPPSRARAPSAGGTARRSPPTSTSTQSDRRRGLRPEGRARGRRGARAGARARARALAA